MRISIINIIFLLVFGIEGFSQSYLHERLQGSWEQKNDTSITLIIKDTTWTRTQLSMNRTDTLEVCQFYLKEWVRDEDEPMIVHDYLYLYRNKSIIVYLINTNYEILLLDDEVSNRILIFKKKE